MPDAAAATPRYTAGIAGIYHHPMLHQLFLRETGRTLGYRAGVVAAAHDKVVLDLGCGTGIMAIFAAQAGARHVYAVEESNSADLAEAMFAANGCADRVTLLRGNSRDLTLPEPADLIVSELFGDDPFDQNVLEYLDDARRRLLAPGGRFLPGRIEVMCVGLETRPGPSASQRWIGEAEVFGDRYGLDMTPYLDMLKVSAPGIDQAAIDTARFERMQARSQVDAIRTEPCTIRDVDFHAMDVAAIMAASRHRLIARADCAIDAVLVYFRLHVDERLRVSTSPFAPRTSWGWWVRDLPRTVFARAGEAVEIVAGIDVVAGRHQLSVSLP